MNTRINLKTPEFSIAEARRNSPSLVPEAENGRAARIARRAEPAAQLIGHRESERLVSRRRDFVAANEKSSKSYGLEDLHIDADEAFRESRSTSEPISGKHSGWLNGSETP